MKKHKFGFTLVELLVVIAIIGILVSLLLPAVQSAREAARRTECTNHLRQLAIATHLYHDSYNAFPHGVLHDTSGSSRWTWRAAILPQIEQSNLHDSINWNVYPYSGSGSTNPSVNISTVQVKLYGCPSDPNRDRLIPYACSNYFANHGSTNTYVGNGIFNYSFFESARKMADITDGQSSTILFGERGIPDSGWGWYFYPYHWDSLLGTYWGYAKGNPKNNDIYTYWSFHPRGSVFVLADSSVKFVPYTINNNTFQALSTRNGGEVVGDY